jgi:hypothetical protein
MKILAILILFCSMLCNPAIANVHPSKADNDLNDLSIVVPSFDRYAELWPATFELFFRNWPNINTKYKNVPIFLISNFKKFDHPRITNILVGDLDKSWSDNIIKGLKEVKTKYVLIFIDDYILNAPVNDKRLIEILTLMKATNAAHTEIAVDPFISDFLDEPKISTVPDLVIGQKFGKHRSSLQTSIWEIGFLKELLKPGESIWYFERHGAYRSQSIKRPFYLVTDKPVFRYLNAIDNGKYDLSVVSHINNQGIRFTPNSPVIKKSLLSRFNNELRAIPYKLLYLYHKIKESMGLLKLES